MQWLGACPPKPAGCLFSFLSVWKPEHQGRGEEGKGQGAAEEMGQELRLQVSGLGGDKFSRTLEVPRYCMGEIET